jgi:hypothetical protein
LDESCTSNSKFEIGRWGTVRCTVQSAISDFEFEMQDSSNFKFLFASDFIAADPFTTLPEAPSTPASPL